MDTQEIMIGNGPVRSSLIVGNIVYFSSQGNPGKSIAFKIGTVTGAKTGATAIRLLGIINPGGPEEMACEIYYDPEKQGSLCGMIYNIKKAVRPMLAAS